MELQAMKKKLELKKRNVHIDDKYKSVYCFDTIQGD